MIKNTYKTIYYIMRISPSYRISRGFVKRYLVAYMYKFLLISKTKPALIISRNANDEASKFSCIVLPNEESYK